jgi:hypothetical protein
MGKECFLSIVQNYDTWGDSLKIIKEVLDFKKWCSDIHIIENELR